MSFPRRRESSGIPPDVGIQLDSRLRGNDSVDAGMTVDAGMIIDAGMIPLESE